MSRGGRDPRLGSRASRGRPGGPLTAALGGRRSAAAGHRAGRPGGGSPCKGLGAAAIPRARLEGARPPPAAPARREPLRAAAAHPPRASAWERILPSLSYGARRSRCCFSHRRASRPHPQSPAGRAGWPLVTCPLPASWGSVRNPSTGGIRPPLGSESQACPGVAAGTVSDSPVSSCPSTRPARPPAVDIHPR